MLVTCNYCGHLCRPSTLDGYDYKCLHCHQDKYLCEVTEYTDDRLEKTYLDWFNNFLTIRCMAMWYHVPDRVMILIVKCGRIIHRNKHKMEDSING